MVPPTLGFFSCLQLSPHVCSLCLYGLAHNGGFKSLGARGTQGHVFTISQAPGCVLEAPQLLGSWAYVIGCGIPGFYFFILCSGTDGVSYPCCPPSAGILLSTQIHAGTCDRLAQNIAQETRK